MSDNAVANDNKYIIWFDIDNTLYPKSTRIGELMGERILNYFKSIGLEDASAKNLHLKYLTEYGLAIRGLTRHHTIDPLDFDAKCDGSLPLEDILRPNPKVRKLIQDMDRDKTRVWALTNAYVNHAKRVLRILELEDLMEGVVFCDYRLANFSCKPETEFYDAALKQADVHNPSKSLFVDDNLGNVRAAKKLGWGSCVYYREPDDEDEGSVECVEGVDATISDLEELRSVWSYVFNDPL